MSPTIPARRFTFPRLLLALALALAALLSLPVQRARAITAIVTNGNDTGPGSLRFAAQATALVDAIEFAPEVKTVTLTSGPILLLEPLHIRGGADGVTIRRSDAEGTPSFAIFSMITGPVTLENLTITNGQNDGFGGGIIFGVSSLTLVNTTVTGNHAGVGGGISSTSTSGVLSLINSTVSGNTADAGGGGIYIRQSTGTELVSGFTRTELINSTVTGNSTDDKGGGIYFADHLNGMLSLTNSTVSANTADEEGGGIFATALSSPSPSKNQVELTNSTVSGNVAWSFDGGAGIYMESGPLKLTNSTISRNAGRHNDGLRVTPNSIATLRHSIVAGSSSDCATTEGGNIASLFVSQGYNLVGSGTGCPSDAPGDQLLTGPLSTAINLELADNGGPTLTHVPVLNGPAYNWIPATECIPTTDQRGVSRPRDGACEIGAVEYAPLVSLNVPIASPGSVALSPAGSGAGPYTYPAGTRISLTALPNRGNLFTGWRVDGAPHGWANPLTVTAGNVQEIQAIFTPPVTFPDVPVGRGDRTAVIELATRGAIRGYQNGNFGPDDGVTRAQMAALIARIMPTGPGTPPEFVQPPVCVNADTWDCEAWDNHFTDQSGVSDALWRDVAALQQHRVAYGYGTAQCAARGLAAPCFGPNDPVTYAQTISFIARAMREKGYWTDQPGASLPYVGIPDAHAADARTFHFYTQGLGGIPIPPGDWDAPATRGWFAMALWVALDSYWGTARP